MEKEIDGKVLIRRGNVVMLLISFFYAGCVIVYGIADIELPGYLAFFGAVIVGIICISYIHTVIGYFERHVTRLENIIQKGSRNS